MQSVSSNAVAQALKNIGITTTSSNGNWWLIPIADKFYLGLGLNKSRVVYSSMTAFIMDLPSGYTIYQGINGNAFADSNTANVTYAIHNAGNGVAMYCGAGTYNAGQIRIQCLCVKN